MKELKIEQIITGPMELVPATNDAPRRKLVSLMKLTSKTCRWPIGTPGSKGFGFCGKRPVDGQPYCDSHCAVAFWKWPGHQEAIRALACE